MPGDGVRTGNRLKIRQYTAGTMQEARLKIKMDLGPDAVILHTRSFKKGGLFGLFGKDMVEVLAAIDTPELGGSVATKRPTAAEELTARIAQANAASASSSRATGANLATGSSAEVAEIKEAVGEVKRMLGTVVEQLDGGTGKLAGGPFARLYEQLVRAELAAPLAKDLVARLQAKGQTELGAEALRSLEPMIAEWVSCSGAIEPPSGAVVRPKIVALVGPTGVGKTTTIAKLAANFRLIHQRSVALITIDTYRVAAVEQLRTYGDIIGIPVEVVVTPGGLREAITRFSSMDVILIDTAGRSPSNRMHLHELKGFLDFPQAKEVHLVLSATTNLTNLARTSASFAPVGIDRLIFTKIDESASFGALVSTAHELGKPISYLTTGQSVPDDIRTAEPAAIARMLVDELVL